MKRYDYEQVWHKFENTPSLEKVYCADGESVDYAEAQARIEAAESSLATMLAWAKNLCECCAGMIEDENGRRDTYTERCYGCFRYGEDKGTPDLWTPAWA